MKTHESGYLVFQPKGVSKTGLTQIWGVYPRYSVDILGFVKWHAPWRTYTFQPLEGTIFDSGCLRCIQEFITAQMVARKAK